MKIEFEVQERENVYAKHGVEYAFRCSLEGKPYWTIKTWDIKPSEADIDAAKAFAKRAFEFYHCHIKLPSFSLEEETTAEGKL